MLEENQSDSETRELMLIVLWLILRVYVISYFCVYFDVDVFLSCINCLA